MFHAARRASPPLMSAVLDVRASERRRAKMGDAFALLPSSGCNRMFFFSRYHCGRGRCVRHHDVPTHPHASVRSLSAMFGMVIPGSSFPRVWRLRFSVPVSTRMAAIKKRVRPILSPLQIVMGGDCRQTEVVNPVDAEPQRP